MIFRFRSTASIIILQSTESCDIGSRDRWVELADHANRFDTVTGAGA